MGWEHNQGQAHMGVLAKSVPNKGVQATAASVRSCLAPAARRA